MKYKKITYGAADFLNGVSTLDAKRGILRFVLSLLLLTVFNSLIFGGHSILDKVDPTFNPQIETSSFTEKTVSAIVPLPGGKVLVAGRFNSYNRQPVGSLIRLNPDATLDATFNNNVLAPGASTGTGVTVLPDGKILVYSNYLLLSGQTAPTKRLIRLNSDGTVDASFDYNGTDRFVGGVTVDASGRVYLSLHPFTGGQTSRIVRLNSDGSIDPSFSYSYHLPADQIAAQNNKLIISSNNFVLRLNENGSWDSSFTRKNISSMLFKKLIVQPDGKVLVLERTLFRINANGGDDTSFTTTNFEGAKGMSLSDDGRITVSEGYTTIFYIKRFLPNGTPDPSFTTYPASNYSCFGVLADGGVLVGDMLIGLTISMPNDFVRLLPSGIRDLSFNPGGTGFQMLNPGTVRAIAVQTNGKIVIGGKFDLANNVARTKIARLNADSTLDGAFQINTNPAAGNYFSSVNEIYNCLVQPDGKVVVSGNFVYTLNGVEKANLVRLNADGGIDATFNPGVFVNDYFGINALGTNRLALFGDGKLLVAASRASVFGSTPPAVPYKLTQGGAPDASFNPPVNPAHSATYIFDAAIQPDGKILIGGIHSAAVGFVTRLNADGSLDPTFQHSEETNKEVRALTLLPNGKVLIIKRSTAVEQSSVQRLNADGSLDASFNAATQMNGRGNALLVLSTGKIFVGGRFSSFNNQPRENLALLNADGSLDAEPYNVNGEVLSLTADGEGRVLVGGSFTTINVGGGPNYLRSYVARLIDSTQASGRTRFDFDGDGVADLGIYEAATGTWWIANRDASQSYAVRFGASGDIPAPADYDNDGKTDVAVYRPSNGTWYLLRSTEGFTARAWGYEVDKPVPGDYDRDGRADIAIYRSSSGTSSGQWYVLPSGIPNSIISYRFGSAGDIPVPADYNGDDDTDYAQFRPSNGTFYWFASGSSGGRRQVQFGQAGDIPAVADYNGDGKADLVVFRPSNGVWYQYLTAANGAYTFAAVQFGQAGDVPVAADYDGDRRADIAVRRGSVWYFLLSEQGFAATTFGSPDAQAVAALPNQ